MIWAWLWDNQSMPSTMSKPASLKGSRDKGKEWFLMDISHPSRTVETVSIVPSANSTSYFTSRVLIGIFSSWQNFWSTKDLSYFKGLLLLRAPNVLFFLLGQGSQGRSNPRKIFNKSR
ncbi:hypothetical protein HanPSC8_Chr08g0331501 [Helianthus annuus]|nr:hypothetical protein HanPSC8_Chr08g0331501 [Helianthus annuus]